MTNALVIADRGFVLLRFNIDETTTNLQSMTLYVSPYSLLVEPYLFFSQET